MNEISNYINDIKNIKYKLIKSVKDYINNIIIENNDNIKKLFSDISFGDSIEKRLNKYFCKNKIEENKISNINCFNNLSPTSKIYYISFNFNSELFINKKSLYEFMTDITIINVDYNHYRIEYRGRISYFDCFTNLINEEFNGGVLLK